MLNVKKIIKKMLYVICVSTFSFSIIWCSKKTINQNNWKKQFDITYQKIEDFSKNFVIKKTWKLLWKQEIIVSSHVNWIVDNIFVNVWDFVKKGNILLTMWDNISNYNLSLQQAKNALDTAKIQYNQTRINLEKNIKDAEILYEKLKTSYDFSKNIAIQNVKKAEIDYKNSLLTWDSLSSVSLSNNVSDIENSVNNLKNQFFIQKTSIEDFLNDILIFSDKLFWVTKEYEIYNDKFDVYLSAKNTSLKNEVKGEILKLYKKLKYVENIKQNNISNDEIFGYLTNFEDIYKKIYVLLADIHSCLEYSINSLTFPQKSIDWYITKVDWFQNIYQQKNTSFTQYFNSFYSLIWTTWQMFSEDKINLLNKQLKTKYLMSKINYDTIKINMKNNVKQNELQLENAKNTLNTARKNYNIQLKSLMNNIQNAKIKYEQMLRQVWKLSISSNIDWNISYVFVDEWQEIWLWTKLFKISNNTSPIVEVWITRKEYKNFSKLKKIFIFNDDNIFTWNLIFLSKTADQNWLYTAQISLSKKVDLLWDIVDVSFFFKSEKQILPLNIITSTSDNKWFVYYLKKKIWQTWTWDFEIWKFFVELWNIWWDNVEILTKIPNWTKLIISDIDNYNPSLNVLNIK